MIKIIVIIIIIIITSENNARCFPAVGWASEMVCSLQDPWISL